MGILKRWFEGLLSMRKNMERSLEKERLEQLETQRKMNEIVE